MPLASFRPPLRAVLQRGGQRGCNLGFEWSTIPSFLFLFSLYLRRPDFALGPSAVGINSTVGVAFPLPFSFSLLRHHPQSGTLGSECFSIAAGDKFIGTFHQLMSPGSDSATRYPFIPDDRNSRTHAQLRAVCSRFAYCLGTTGIAHSGGLKLAHRRKPIQPSSSVASGSEISPQIPDIPCLASSSLHHLVKWRKYRRMKRHNKMRDLRDYCDRTGEQIRDEIVMPRNRNTSGAKSRREPNRPMDFHHDPMGMSGCDRSLVLKLRCDSAEQVP